MPFIRQSILASLLVSGVVVGFSSSLALAECQCPYSQPKAETQPINLLAIHVPAQLTQAKFTASDLKLIQGYIQEQFRVNSITAEQFMALPTEKQKQALLPGKQLALSREDEHAIVPFKTTVPSTITSQLLPQKTVRQSTLAQYGIPLPSSLGVSSLPKGYQRLVIGDRLVLIGPENVVVDTIKEVF